MDEKRDKKALGLALVTLPITVVTAATGADSAMASQVQSQNPTDQPKDDQTKNGQNGAGQLTAATSPSTAVATKTQLSYTVKAGDTVSKIARKFQLSTNQLLQINKLTAKSFIFPGQKLKLVADAVVPASKAKADATKTHVVRAGETVSLIAKKYSVSVSTVLAMNKLSASAIIFPGQKLIIGSVVAAPTKPVIPTEHIVAVGETLNSIAEKYDIQLNVLLTANGLTESSLVYNGQTLKLKGTAAPVTSSPTETPNATPLSSVISSTDPHRPSSVCQVHGYHTVKTGESVSKIAAVYGVSTQAVLSANKLTWSSTIFVGQKLIIPGVHEIQFCPELIKMTDEMFSNAKTIYRVARELGVSDYGIVIALATAMQESGLRNLSYGDRDSVGLFQQRPSAHWGTVEEIMNTEYAARAFFGGKTSPTYGVARGLLDIKNWSAKSLTEAAQAVQISAYPNAYAKWEASAWVWLDQLMSAEQN